MMQKGCTCWAVHSFDTSCQNYTRGDSSRPISRLYCLEFGLHPLSLNRNLEKTVATQKERRAGFYDQFDD